MPPTAKFSKEKIVEAALDIVRTEGFDALTARALGTKLGSSARPIFTVFSNMEEVQQSVTEAAKMLYKEYVRKGLSQSWNPVYFILHKRAKTVPASFYDRAQTDSRFGRRTAFD